MMRTPDEYDRDAPDSIVDLQTGYALNVPLGRQEVPTFWKTPVGVEMADRIYRLRKEAGIVVLDDMIDMPTLSLGEPAGSSNAFDLIRAKAAAKRK